MKEKQYSVKINKLPKSLVEVEGEISWENLTKYEEKAYEKLAEKLELPGFRKGNIPKDIAKKQIPDEILIADMAELAINDVYPSILADNKLDIIGRPNVSITKIARGNPLTFKIDAAVVPEIKLPNYKKISGTVALDIARTVTEEDVDKVVEDLRHMRAYGHTHGEGDEHKHEEPLPELNDEFAKSFGKFQTLAEFRAKIKENLMLEADQAVKDKRRISIMESIISETQFDVPDIILQSEADKMIATIEADVARSGATLDDYLKHIKKTKDELIEEFKPEADKRARFQLVLNAIAREEKILPTEEEVEAEAQKFMAMYPGADPNRTKAYADMMLTNEKVLALLEQGK